MKLPFLYCLLLALPMAGFSQKPTKDPAKEKNDLIALKATLVQESASMQGEMGQMQTSIDSLSRKLTMDSIDLAKIKATDPVGQKAYIKNNEKKLQSYRTRIDRMNKDLDAEKAQQKQAADLIKDLDAQIGKL